MVALRIGGQQTRRIGGMSLARIANGQLVEAWDQRDKFAMLQHIGAVPALPATTAAKSANG